MAAGAAVPLPRAQRRDQHDPGQPQLGHGAQQELPLGRTQRYFRSRSDHLADRVGLVDARQHARGIACRGYGRHPGNAYPAAARLADRRQYRSRRACLLRIFRLPARALGRAGRHRPDRRPLCPLLSRPQRPAAGALGADQGPTHHDRLRNRRLRLRGQERRRQGASRSGRNARGGPGQRRAAR